MLTLLLLKFSAIAMVLVKGRGGLFRHGNMVSKLPVESFTVKTSCGE
jgi:hypothetical protein